jgi:hypothetical protein
MVFHQSALYHEAKKNPGSDATGACYAEGLPVNVCPSQPYYSPPAALPRAQQFFSSFHQLLFYPLRLSHTDIIAEFSAQSGFHYQSGALR